MLPVAVLSIATIVAARAPELVLPALFSDHMVLQRSSRVPIWGRATPGAEVTVKASWSREALASAVADERGEWRLELETPDAGGPHSLTVTGDVELVLQDVLVGEVWLCAGQSNMEWAVGPGPLGGVFDWPKVLAAADRPRIRHFDVPNTLALSEQRECGGRWEVCTPKTVERFSAVAYFFACELERELGVPVGLVNATWSGTPIQSWLDEAAAARFESSAAALGPVTALRASGAALSDRQRLGLGPGVGPASSSVLFNAMVAPLAPYGLRGFLWYQGESDRERADHYDALQSALIASWRERFARPDAPFYYVQIAPFAYGGDRGETGALRDAQRRVLAVPGVGMAVTLDLGDPADIHPRNKQDVGRRLARWALNKTYGRGDVAPSGPLVREAVRDGGKVRIRFDHVGEGLISAADHLEGFELVDAAGVAVRARAEIDGEQVVLWSPQSPAPVLVRYGYGAAMQPVLFNKSWLPAAAFCVRVTENR